MGLMVYIALNLTILTVFAILNSRKKKVSLKKVALSQVDLHGIVKGLIPSNAYLRRKKSSQMIDHIKKNITKVMATPDQKVYWVKDNEFLYADLVDGGFNPAEARLVETHEMSKEDVKKMLFILDNLTKDI
jgi:hypothetical protein